MNAIRIYFHNINTTISGIQTRNDKETKSLLYMILDFYNTPHTYEKMNKTCK